MDVEECNGTMTNTALGNWTLNISTSVHETTRVDGYETVRWIQVIGRPPIIALGTLGNVLAFIAMQRGSLKNLSTCFYMAILAVADTGE